MSLSLGKFPLQVLEGGIWALGAEGDGRNPNKRDVWNLLDHRQAERCQTTLEVCRGPPAQGAIAHLQLQGRPLPCLHTCQATATSLDSQEDGELGAFQASVGEYADSLWEGIREESQVLRGTQIASS